MSEIENFIKSILLEESNAPLTEMFEIRKYPKGFTFGPHCHTNIEINFVKKGSCKLKFNDEVVKFQANDCMVIFPETTHSFLVDNQGVELVQLEFRMDLFPELKPAPSTQEHLLFLHDVLTHSQRYLKISMNNPLMSLIERIVDELNQRQEHFLLLTRIYYTELFFLFSRHLSETLKYTREPKNESLIKAIQMIHSTFTDTISIEQIAGKCDISARYLRKLFEKEIGLSPIDFITILRINSSKERLRNTSISLKEIAFSTGFENQQYFSKRFKQHTGISPLEYRKLLLKTM